MNAPGAIPFRRDNQPIAEYLAALREPVGFPSRANAAKPISSYGDDSRFRIRSAASDTSSVISSTTVSSPSYPWRR